MTELYHVVLKDHENSGYVWDDFFCPGCLNDWVTNFDHLEILRQNITTPHYLSRLYPPIVSEPHCRNCGVRFTF